VSAADAQQDSEISDLQTVISLANETLFDLINATITANYTAQLDALDTTYSDNTSDVSDFTFSACCCVKAVGILVQLLTLALAPALPHCAQPACQMQSHHVFAISLDEGAILA